MKFCPECGKEIKDAMRFCTNCGADLNKHREAEARRQAAAQAAGPAPESVSPEASPKESSAEVSPFAAFVTPDTEKPAPLFPEAPVWPALAEQPEGQPDASDEIPEPPTEIPKLPTEIPEPPTEIPELPTDIPELPTDIPELPTEIPEPPTEIPELPTDIPELPTDIPEPPAEIPEFPADIPEPPASAAYTPKYKEGIRRARDHFYYSDLRFALPAGSFDFRDELKDELDTMIRVQLEDAALWTKFVDLFRNPGVDDADSGWRCEYWGKMMRGACFTYAALPASAAEEKDALYAVLEATVRDLLTAQDEYGRFSTYSVDAEFAGWDIWGRKYVLLGMLYFLDICRDDSLADEIVEALKRHADYMIEKLGRPEEGKRLIAACTSHWDGLNSCSVLEPFMLLYNITHEPRYFDFAEYIISFGGTLHQNLFELAYEDKVSITDYSVTKAYEMISCFEGLAEYAKVTGDKKSRDTVIRFAERVLKEEETVIGCLGCFFESFDKSAVAQFDPERRGIMQETCVTVTWMKFCWQLWRMTGENKWIDAIERSACNAMSASLRRYMDKTAEENGGIPLPVHSYNPLRHDVRVEQIGGKKNINAESCYGCCVCISTAGFALDALSAAGTDRKGTLYVNLYRNGSVTLDDFTLRMDTDYPKSGLIRFTAEGCFAGKRKVVLRIPGWAESASLTAGGVSVSPDEGSASFTLSVEPGAVFELNLAMPTRIITPAEASHGLGDSDLYLAVARGPVLLVLDETVEEEPVLPIDAARVAFGEAELTDSAAVPCREAVRVPLTRNGTVTLIDYASAGQEPGHKVCAWIRVK